MTSSESGPEGPPLVKVAWDYEAFPVWWFYRGDESRLSPGLRGDLQAWSDRLTVLMSASRRSGCDVDPEPLEALVVQGRWLARRVASTLGPEIEVTYYNEVTREEERIEPPLWQRGPQ